MNTKRWIAIVIAFALFFLTLLVPTNDTGSSVDELLQSKKLKEEELVAGTGNRKIVRLEIDGTITSSNDGMLSNSGYDHAFFMKQLKTIEKDSDVKGILLEVNSPGGGVYESSEVATELKKIQKKSKIPVYVSMKSMAASGGYYISASANKIYASEETMTGSIGVIMSGLDMTGLLDKVGIKGETIKSGELKDMGSATREWTAQDKEVYQTMIDASYDRFVSIVADGRDMSEDEVKKIADGRIYDGAQAKKNGLVDGLGFPEDVLKALRKDYKLADASVVQYTEPKSLLLDRLPLSFLSKASKKESDVQVISSLIHSFGTEDSPRMMYLYGGE